MARKVCILTTVHPPFDTRIFHKQAKTLVRAGYDVALICRHSRNETVDGVRILRLPEPNGRLGRIFTLTLKALRLAIRENADIYHFHDPELIPVGACLKLFRGSKIIYDAHENYEKLMLSKPYIPKPVRRIAAFLIGTVERLSAKLIDCAIAANDVTKNLSRYTIARSVRNYPILSLFSRDIERTRNNNSFNLVYVGALFKDRGITKIVEAMEQVDSRKEVRLTLCGRYSPSNYLSDLQNMGGYERTEYIGPISYEDVPEVLAGADAGIVCLQPIPNYLTASHLPVKLFEYMAAGIPVIASDFPVWREVIESSECGICVDPSNPGEIAQAIEHLFDNREIARNMGENGRKVVFEKYSWENEGKKLLDIYEELMRDSHGHNVVYKTS